MQKESTIRQFKGNPREPEAVPLANAGELNIRQVLDKHGEPNGDLCDPELPREDMRQLYETMVMLRAIDERGMKLQRSGRIAFWIPLRGQEACQTGATHAMSPDDWIFRAHRELAPWLMRGAPLELLFAQFFGAEADIQRGRRLPCLGGSRAINVIFGPTQIGSYIPHACGAGWAAKLKGRDHCVLNFFGDGSTSRGEFHSAMNFAGIHRPFVIFVCINNAWAVSTPLDCQTAMLNFAAKGDAYGIRNVRVDGNDPLAMYAVTKEARKNIKEYGPTLIEAVTYRLGFHTSSDNPDLYRKQAEIDGWNEWDPLRRTRLYMEKKGWWSDADERDLQQRCENNIQKAVDAAGKMELPGPDSQFDHFYGSTDRIVEEQRQRILSELEDRDNSCHA